MYIKVAIQLSKWSTKLDLCKSICFFSEAGCGSLCVVNNSRWITCMHTGWLGGGRWEHRNGHR